MKINNYNKVSKELISQTIANENPLVKGEYLIPANATNIEVIAQKDGFIIYFNEEINKWEYIEIPTIYVYDEETNEYLKSHKNTFLVDFKKFNILEQETTLKPLDTKEGFTLCFNKELFNWEYIEDNRNKIVYSITDKLESKIDYLGVIKEGFTLNQPKQFDKWNGNSWEADIGSIKTSKIAIINSTTENAIISGFKSSSLGAEYLYQSDRDDQLNLMGLVSNGTDNFLKCGLVSVILENNTEKEVITWDYKLHTTEQLKQVLADGAKYKLDLLIKANTLKIQVQNVTTVLELDDLFI